MRSLISSRVSTILGSFFVALLVLTQFSHAQAGPGPISVVTTVPLTPVAGATSTPRPTSTPAATATPRPTSTPVPTATSRPTYGVVNGSFGPDGNCSLAGWTTSGAVGLPNTAMTEDQHCYATLQANVGTSQDTAASSLEQGFLVDPAQPYLLFYVNPTSDLPDVDYPAQTISLYNSAGQVIYERSRNLHVAGQIRCEFGFLYDLSAYAGQLVRLRISVKASTERGAPTNVSMKVDFDKYSWPCVDGGPDDAPPTRW
jgi:hypothetical protein